MRQISAKLHDLSSVALSAILQHNILNMKKDTIIQFVCFVTALGPDEFAPQWEKFSKRLKVSKAYFYIYQLQPLLFKQKGYFFYLV